MISTSHDIQGKLIIRKYDLNGKLVLERESQNQITTAGRELVANLFKFNIVDTEQEDKIKRITQIHLGSNKKDFSPGQKKMQTYVGQTEITKVENVPTNDNRVKLRFVGELTTDKCNGTLKEAGLFTEDDEPVMYNRVTFDTITKSEEFELTLIWELTF